MLTADELMRQACSTAKEYMFHAQIDIDKAFGEGHSAKHPELVAAYMQTAALDFMASFGLQSVAEELARLSESREK